MKEIKVRRRREDVGGGIRSGRETRDECSKIVYS